MANPRFDFKSVQNQKIDISQIRKTYKKAIQSLVSAKKLEKSDPDGSFTLAYDAMLKASLCLMYSYKYRPRVQLGHHKTLVNFSEYVLGEGFSALIAAYDKMRDKRNKLLYDVSVVSRTGADNACKIAEKYLKIVADKIIENNPQMKLW